MAFVVYILRLIQHLIIHLILHYPFNPAHLYTLSIKHHDRCFIHAYIYTYIHTYAVHTYMLICIHIYTYTHTEIYTFMHIHIHTYTHTYIHTYIHPYNTIHTYIHTHLVNTCYKMHATCSASDMWEALAKQQIYLLPTTMILLKQQKPIIKM